MLSFPLCINAQTPDNNMIVNNVNAEIIANEIHDGGKSGIQRRNLYIFVEEKEFNLDTLRKLFDKYKKVYEKPYILTVSVYSDKEMLQKLINFNNQNFAIDFTNDEEGRKAAQEYYEKYYPLPKGYLRAEYKRYGKFEYFDYSPAKEKIEMIRILLKD